MRAIYDNATIVAKLRHARAIAERIGRMRRKRIAAAFRAAHLGDINLCSLHNAILSADEGMPWREVDYSAARLAKRLCEDYRASRIIDAYYHRMCGIAP